MPQDALNSVLPLTRIKPEEDVSGYVVCESANHFSGSPRVRLTFLHRAEWVCPSGLGSVAQAFGGLVPDLHELIHSHTRFRIFEPFQSLDEQKRLYEHHAGPSKRGSARTFPEHARGQIAVCPQCIDESRRCHGYAIWQRLHLMPGIQACPKHQRALLTCSVCNAKPHRTIPPSRPSSKCHCGRPMKPFVDLNPKGEQATIAIAQMADDLQRGKVTPQISSTSVQNAIRAECRIGLEGRATLDTLAEQLIASVGLDVFENAGIGTETLSRLAGSHRQSNPLRNPIQHLLVIYGVFGGWEGLYKSLGDASDSLDWSPTESPKVAHVGDGSRISHLRGEAYVAYVQSLPECEISIMRERSRNWLLKQLAANPRLRRADLHSSSAAVRFLRTVDADYLNQELPPLKVPMHTCDVETLSQRIRGLESRIHRRRQSSLAECPYRRLTRSYLLDDGRFEPSSVLKSPQVVQALKICVDTYQAWRHRAVEELCCKVRMFANLSVYGDEKIYRTLRPKAFRALVAKVAQLLEEQKC